MSPEKAYNLLFEQMESRMNRTDLQLLRMEKKIENLLHFKWKLTGILACAVFLLKIAEMVLFKGAV